jgi:hypothetical protein
MAKDRRYTHYLGRPLNRFEADKQHGPSQSQSSRPYAALAAQTQAQAQAQRKKVKERRAELVFDSSMPSLAELHSLDDGDDDF